MAMSLMFKRVFLAAMTALILIALVWWSGESQAGTAEQWLNELGRFVGPYAG